MNTFKLCNFRNCECEDKDTPPHPGLNPCRVYRDSTTGKWYDELTGASIRTMLLPDGQEFDAQLWLEQQWKKVVGAWDAKDTVHEPYTMKFSGVKVNTPAARSRKNSGEDLDKMADELIRSNEEKRDLQDELREVRTELHGYRRIGRKWGGHPMLENRLRELEERRDDITRLLNELGHNEKHARKHLRHDNAYARRWSPKKTNWFDFLFVREVGGRILSIDRHGFKVDGQYLYLPDTNRAFGESMTYAQQRYGLRPEGWKRLKIPAEKIGTPIRRYGKRNANGARISARADQRKYAETVLDLIRALNEADIFASDIRSDEDILAEYQQKIAPRLQNG